MSYFSPKGDPKGEMDFSKKKHGNMFRMGWGSPTTQEAESKSTATKANPGFPRRWHLDPSGEKQAELTTPPEGNCKETRQTLLFNLKES